MKKTVILTIVVFMFLGVSLYSQENKYYGADYIFEKDNIAIFWAVLKGDEIESNLVYINLVPLDSDNTVYRKYSVIESNVFSGEENILVKYKKIKDENILKKTYGGFLTMSETNFLFYRPGDSKKNPNISIYYKGVPDAAPEFKDEKQIFDFFEHSLEKVKAQK
jgi:hypothetical protein